MQPEEQNPAPNQTPISPKTSSSLPVIILSGITLLLIVGIVSLYLRNQSLAKNQSENTSPTEVQTATSPQLPPDAVKISECIPYEGEHWVLPKDLPYGPFYSVYNGKVISTEYMITAEEIPGAEGATMSFDETLKIMQEHNLSFSDLVESLQFGFDLYGYNYESFDIHWSAPHAGFDVPHYDIHFFLVDKEELNQICPDSQIENVYSPQIMQSIEEHNIPFPTGPVATSEATLTPTEPVATNEATLSPTSAIEQ